MDIHEHLKKIVEGRKAVIIELGCCDGTDTLEIYQTAVRVSQPPVRYIALEPDPRNMPQAKERLRDYPVEFIDAAITDKEKLCEFWQSSGSSPAHKKKHPDREEYYGSSSIREPTGTRTAYKGMKFEVKLVVRGMCLDTIYRTRKLNHIDFIWSDIQGAEADMIAGGIKLALPNTRYLFIEIHDQTLYDGGLDKDGILKLLPSWELVDDFEGGGHILLKNKAIA